MRAIVYLSVAIASVPRRLRDTINVEIGGQRSVESARVEDMITDRFECGHRRVGR
jgi:hypothetical protein